IELIRQCVRCNVEFPLQMEGSLCRYFQFGNCVSEAEKTEVFECLPSPGLINLVDVLREEVWLAWKPMVVCRKSCKGICQQCGKDLNRHECSCSQNDDDNPFAALRSIRFDS
ncbi:MAG: YceD family protein, partial [Mariprofundaceae bacterium]